ncbi:MAG TPA: NAD(P)/FAD-dependent oxidoreductase [Propionibacteriaceae bacterium]
MRHSTPLPLSAAGLDVVVVGAGQAGLALGWHLAQLGVRFLLLESAGAIGQSWRSRWDSLRLFTPAEYDSLPGLPFPARSGHYPTKDEVADYLADYAAHFALPVLLNTTVTRAIRSGDRFEVQTNQGALTAAQVVVATGPFQEPFVPALAQGLGPAVTQLHSAQYRNPRDLPSGRVLVVGAGNSGLQIAVEVAATRDVHVAVGTKPAMVPQRILGRDLFWWLTRTGALTRPSTSPVTRFFRSRGGDLVIGSDRRGLRRAGVQLQPRLIGAEGSTVTFGDGTALDVDAVVWATGYRFDYSWLAVPGATDREGRLRHERGVCAVPGLYTIGQPWQHSRGSALLGFVKDDASWLARTLSTSPGAGAVPVGPALQNG